MSKSHSPSRRGAVAVLVALSMVALLGVLALAVESGRSFDVQRRVQMAADAAALAGATEVYRTVNPSDDSVPPGDPVAIAQQFASDNGYSANLSNTVTVSMPPNSGSFVGKNGFLQVEIQTRLKRTFSAVFGSGDLVIRATSVAGGTTIPTKASILILEPKKGKSLNLRGGSTRLVSNSDIFVNSRDKNAVRLDKKSQLAADGLMVAGGMDRKSKGTFSGDLFTGVQPTPDPYASLPIPPTSKELNISDFKTSVDGRDYYTLPPGTYQDLKFDHDDVVKLLPGVFVVLNEFNVHDKASMSGTGVMLYFNAKKDVKFDTTGSVSLSPSNTGTYAGVTLFMSRTSKKKLLFKRDANYDIEGIIYAPNAEVKFQHTEAFLSGDDQPEDEDWEDADYGGPDTTGSLKASLVAKKLTIDKHSEVHIDGDGIDAQRPFLGLIE